MKYTRDTIHPQTNMNAKTLICSLGLAVGCVDYASAAGPYAPTNWPPTIDPAKKVHFAVADLAPSFLVPNDNWTNSLFWVTGGDQAWVSQQVCDPTVTFSGNKATSTYINIGDYDWQFWNAQPTVDVLVQVYGDDTVMIPPALTSTRVWRFREGTTGTLVCAPGGATQSKTVNGPAVPTGIHNFKWNWLLLQITNEPVFICSTNSGNRWLGSVNPGSSGNATYGGINGGTMRMNPSSPSVWTGLIIHAMAWGESGAFGDPNDINLFEPADVVTCDPVPAQNLVGIDFNAGLTNHLQVMNDGDQTVTYAPSAGPAGDPRKAVIPDGAYLNFGILSNFLGQPCNPNVAIKVCADFYDDPAFAGAGVLFGPEAYAADQFGGACAPNGIYPSTGLYSMQGTGKWVRKSWTIPGVNLFGVNTAPLTGGPRFVSTGGQVAVSRFEMAALRTTGPLAGLDPLADCRPDPLVCEDAYGNYAELDLANGITNGLDLGTQSSDQAYLVETAGPAGDLRTSVRNADGTTATYLNFKLLTNSLGPVTQGNCRLAIAVTYFDDPALAGRGLRPQTWKYDSAGVLTDGFLNAPQDNIILQGSNTWREAYWEIGRITFNSVNENPYAATRFQADFGADTTKKIHISRVRYAVIRDCGTNAGVNLLATNFTPVKMAATPGANGLIKLSWPYHAPQALVQSVTTLGLPWANFPGYNPGVATVEGGETRTCNVTNSADSQFFRLRIPSVP
jgi:hypothetical protein